MNNRTILISVALCLLLAGGSCNLFQFGSKDISSTTGWAYNDPQYGGFEVKSAVSLPSAPGLVFIEGGSFIMGRVAESLDYEWNNQTRRVTLDSYYIDETEVRNIDYREYIYWLQRVYVSYPVIAKNALPDTLVWRRPLAFNEPYVSTYFRHPAYDQYPVVGVSWRQANDFCLWRSDRVNEISLYNHGILKLDPSQKDSNSFNTDAYLMGRYQGIVNRNLRDYSKSDPKATRRVTFDDGILFPNYRLPTEAEWEYAAVAQIGSTYDERVVERRVYPWSGTSIRSAEKSSRGKFLANFQRGRGDLMGVAGHLNDGYALTAPVRSFYPNDYGLYCMAGNVNEWVSDVYRPLSFEELEEFRPFRGNVFLEYSRDENGNILPKDSLGRMRRDTVGYLGDERYNYQLGDLRNYKDGDVLSSINYEQNSETDPESNANSDRMYDQGIGAGHRGMSTLISDKARVYKGGSFLDRAYWLSPGTRRYLDEDRSAVDIGFRCAMDKLGEPQRIKR
ncbi:MAG: SUMF1/EgtB/PvdO family nonheme iron enzyme [Prevotellaceae bacterium]|nr:SUMF1/EgtB/PvdO family nonheme iron enzyme [Prevotellaceae bacterium]